MSVTRLEMRASASICGRGRITEIDLECGPIAPVEAHTSPALAFQEQPLSPGFLDAGA
jgi:hypothetical protein